MLTGTRRTGATALKPCTTLSRSFTVDNDGQITATSPAGTAGAVDVTVTGPGGTSATGAADQYPYLAAPSVSGVAPASGPAVGGTSVKITGGGRPGATGERCGAED